MANAQPIFIGSLRNRSTTVITGSSTSDGVGSVLLFQADVNNGSRVHAISAVYSGSVSTASVLRLWRENATNYTLLLEVPVLQYTATLGAPAVVSSLLDNNYAGYLDPADPFLTLAPGDSLYVSVYNTIDSAIHITAWGGDY